MSPWVSTNTKEVKLSLMDHFEISHSEFFSQLDWGEQIVNYRPCNVQILALVQAGPAHKLKSLDEWV
jgi:hypothetical protein